MKRTSSTRRGCKIESNVNEQNPSNTRSNTSNTRTTTGVRQTRKTKSERNVIELERNVDRNIITITDKTDGIDKALKSNQTSIPTTPKCRNNGKSAKVTRQKDGGCIISSTILASPNLGTLTDCNKTSLQGQEESPSLTQADKRMKEILRDDNFFSSQSVGEVVCDVQWECASPDVCKQLLRKCNRNKKTVSEIALGLKVPDDEIHANDTENMSEPFLGLWIQEPNDSGKSVLKPRRIPRKRSALRKKEKAAQIIPEKYQILLEKLNAEQSLEKKLKEENTRKRELKDSSDDLYDQLFSDEDQLLTTGLVRCNGKSPPNTANDTWSDDDLFNEDSFIVAASQIPIETLSEMCNSSKRKRESLGLSGKSLEDTKINTVTEDVNNNKGLDTDSIRKTTTSYQSNWLNLKKCDTKNDFIKNKEQTTFTINSSKPKSSNIPNGADDCLKYSPDETTVLSHKTFYGKSKSNFRKHSSFSGSPTMKSGVKNELLNTLEASKSPFRKHHSFDACQHHLTSTPTRKSYSKKNYGEPRILQPDTSSKTNTCKSYASNSSKQMLHIDTNHSHNSLLPQIKEESCKSTVMDSRGPIKTKTEDSFLDTSISDEILKQLVEPDEIFDSQMTPETIVLSSAPTKNCADKALALLFEDDFSFSEVETESRKKFDMTGSQTFQKEKKSVIDHEFNKKPVYEVNNQGVLTKPIHAINRNVNQFISAERNESNCNQGKYSFKNVSKHTIKDSSLVSSINNSNFEDAANKSDIDLILGTQELFNDNSFLNEDPLLESQFLAELDKVESTL